jgi:hypothetical protein
VTPKIGPFDLSFALVVLVWHGAVSFFCEKLHRNNKSVPTRSNILNTAQTALEKARAHNCRLRTGWIGFRRLKSFVLSWHHRAKTEIILFYTSSFAQPYNLLRIIPRQWQALQKLEECGGSLSEFSTLISCIIHFGRAP